VARLPAGTVTFLFTDVEGSTRLLHELGDAYADVLGEHRRALRECFGRHGGVEVDTQGDASFVAFPNLGSTFAELPDASNAATSDAASRTCSKLSSTSRARRSPRNAPPCA
jgi:class 3 adenylate cyclase